MGVFSKTTLLISSSQSLSVITKPSSFEWWVIYEGVVYTRSWVEEEDSFSGWSTQMTSSPSSNLWMIHSKL